MMSNKKIWKQVLHDMRLNLVALGILTALAAAGILIIRVALLRNAWNTGTALSRNYAAEEQGNLVVYETLLSFGTNSIDRWIEMGNSREELEEWLKAYYDRLENVLGEGIVDPYAIIDGEIWAANPWENDDSYDFYNTEWYQKAQEAQGEVIFTNLYTDAIYGKPVITAAQRCENENVILAFDIFPENFPFRFHPLDLEAGDSFFLCDSTGTIIYKQTDLSMQAEDGQQYLNALIDRINAGEFTDYRDSIIDQKGHRRAVYYTQMENGWFSIITIPYNNILKDMEWTLLLFFAILGVFLLVLAGVAWRDMRVNKRIYRTNETVRVLGNSYYALYRVNLTANTYEIIKGSDFVRQNLSPHGGYDELIQVIAKVIEPDAAEDFKKSFSQDNIRQLVSQRIRDFGGEFQRLFNDEYRWVSVRVLFDESLSPGEVVLSFRIVDAEKQRQLQERKLLEDALEMTRKNESAKQTFFSSMSHDMRTPLNAIIGLSELAERHAGNPEEMLECLRKINTASRQLLELINDILDMSRMEQGKLTLDQKPINLKECVEECAGPFRLQAAANQKEFSVQIHLDDPIVVADSFRITQILNNLLSNALKFTGEGGRISLSLTQLDGGDYAKYKIVVSDTGIGMAPEFLPHLFEPYSRELRFSARQASGTGLGMSITRSLVTQMNGEIQVESEPGKGSTFTIVLPFAVVGQSAAEKPTAKEKQPLNLDGCRILLAEDNEVNMEIASELLSMNGVIVTEAWNGLEAVEKFRQSEPFFFDAILMDMQMPKMDGCEAARTIRALQRPDAQTVPIIAVTANAFAEDLAATAAAGMNAHISKPMDVKILYQTIQKLIAESKS